MVRNHKWDKDDTIITLYFVKHDLKGLPVKDEKDLAENIIGSTKASLTMQAANIRYILGYDDGILSDYSDLQKEVVDEYIVLSKDELKAVVMEIIFGRDVEENRKRAADLKKQKEAITKKKAQQADLEALFIKMGKDPSKMKLVK